MPKLRTSVFVVSLLFPFFLGGNALRAQSTWFADGYHGGIYGHYPLWVTQFMTDTLHKYKDWHINLEIEPETWDTVQAKDPQGYRAFQQLFTNATTKDRIEYTNPSYAQSYLFPISGESIIRQFQYGMQKLKEHFPSAQFTTYSSEEPCFTSALPQLLTSLGFTHAVLKNPNTCWGGYTKAHGGETVSWIGPDGTTLTTVPRYASEALEPNSTWQTIAWNNSPAFIQAAFGQGIAHPVGMCLQDAGWRNGRWLGRQKSNDTYYTTWRNYFNNVINPANSPGWRLSQEDIAVSLVWGSQVLQRIAQQVRMSENKLITAEKMASLAKLYAGMPYPKDTLDAAWRTLMLSQHHDCWIVPYNGKPGHTWADNVKDWTTFTNEKSNDIIAQAANEATPATPQNAARIAVYNTSGTKRNELVSFPLSWLGTNASQNATLQTVTAANGTKEVLGIAAVPAMGYAVYNASELLPPPHKAATWQQLSHNIYILETDKYKLTIDAAKGGAITSLVAKELGNKEFADPTSKGLNVLRGNFYKEGGMLTSANQTATVSVIEQGPWRVAVEIKGGIGQHTYTQTIRLTQGEDLIDCHLHIDYNVNLRVGEDYRQDSGYNATDLHKAFYNDTCKLMALFPLTLNNQKVYKDAPFDVTESQLDNTFFNRWDSIKNNIILNWVDVRDETNDYGFALLTDHTTSYAHGNRFPLGLTVQYAGVGLWGRNYKTDSATNFHYALLPHAGKWSQAALHTKTEQWNMPVAAFRTSQAAGTRQSLVSLAACGWQITSLTFDKNDLLLRLYNAEGSTAEQEISIACRADKAVLTELNNRDGAPVSSRLLKKKTKIRLAIPQFGIRTIRLVNARLPDGKP